MTIEEAVVDMPQIAIILQTMGFKLESVDPLLSNEKTDNQELKIEVTCKKSGMRALLSKQIKTCVCPTPELAKQSQFWVVSGAGPSTSQNNLNKIDETRSNLIPSLSKEKSSMIKNLVTTLCSILSETDINQNEKVTTSFKNSRRIRRSCSDLCVPTTSRPNNWEVDPKITPPTGTSSPLPESCSRLSLNNEKEQLLVDYLQTAKENLEKALTVLPPKNNTFTKSNLKRVSNILPSPATPTRATTGASTQSVPKKTPKGNKSPTPKSTLAEKRKLVTSKIGSFRKNTDLLTPSLTKSKKINSPTFLDKKKASPLTITNSGKKLSNLRASNPNLAASSGVKTVKSKTGIPTFGGQFGSSKINANVIKKSK